MIFGPLTLVWFLVLAVITALLAMLVARDVWGWRLALALLVFGAFLVLDLAFFGANAMKFVDGGWFPVLLAAAVFLLMTTWKRGRSILADRLRDTALPLDLLLKEVAGGKVERVPGTAVFMTGNPHGSPPALLHNLKHNKVLHERVVLLTLESLEVPRVPPQERLVVEDLEGGFHRVIARYGFMQSPSVPRLLGRLRRKGLELEMMETSFFLGRETLIPSARGGMMRWRKALFGWMSRNARPATSFFEIPPNRVVELGAQIEL